MASDFKNDDLDIGLNDSSSDFFSQEEGDLFEELFAGSESMSFEDELADINIDDIDLNEVLQVSDDIEVPSFDDLSDLEGLDLVDALLSEDEEPLMSDFGIEEELASTQEHDLEKSEQEEFDQINDFADIDLMSLLGDDEEMAAITEGTTQGTGLKNSSYSLDGKGNVPAIEEEDLSNSMADVFSDALSVLSSKQDAEEDNEEEETEKNFEGTASLGNVTGSPKPKEDSVLKRLYAKLFKNIVDEKEIEKKVQEQKEKEAKLKQQEAELEKKKLNAEEKAKKKEDTKLEKARKKEDAAAAKEQKKLEKKEAKELRALEEEAEIEGRINKIGAVIVFIVMAMMAMFIFFGTKLFSYSNSISNAKAYLENGQYNESYKELLGVEIKKEDQVLFDKVVTVMYVYKQLEAYDIYYKESRYPEALDSLLKGIREYEKYIPTAIELDVSSDLDTIRRQIVTELEAEYGITEDMASEINQITDSHEYSKRVFDLAQDLASYYY